MQFTNLKMGDSTTIILSFANLLGLVSLVFAVGRFAEKVATHSTQIRELAIKVEECEDNRIDNAIASTKMEAFKVALDNSNRLIENIIHGKTRN